MKLFLQDSLELSLRRNAIKQIFQHSPLSFLAFTLTIFSLLCGYKILSDTGVCPKRGIHMSNCNSDSFRCYIGIFKIETLILMGIKIIVIKL